MHELIATSAGQCLTVLRGSVSSVLLLALYTYVLCPVSSRQFNGLGHSKLAGILKNTSKSIICIYICHRYRESDNNWYLLQC